MANKNHRSIEIKEDKRCFEILHKDETSFEILHKDEFEDSDSDDDYNYDDYDLEDEDEQIKEEMTPPKVTTGEDGSKGVLVVIKHDWSTLGKRKTPPSAFDFHCQICRFQSVTTGGDHRLCCLPCGHMFGMSCINYWLRYSEKTRVCAICDYLCTFKDIIVLYPPSRTESTLLKVSTIHFPFTHEGLRDFEHYALKRRADALKLRTATLKRKAVVVDCMLDALKRKMDEQMRRRALWNQGKAWQKSPDKVLDQNVETLQQSVNAWERKADAFGCRADALRRRADILKWRAKACKAGLNFFEQKCNEHMRWVQENTKQQLE